LSDVFQELAAYRAQLNLPPAGSETDRHTVAKLEIGGMVFFGGGNGRYLVYLTFDNDNFNYLVNLSSSDKTEILVIGGQEGIYPAKSCVDLATTIKAAKAFAQLGTMERSVSWEREGVPEPVS
jgi:Immunity protein Imm1